MQTQGRLAVLALLPALLLPVAVITLRADSLALRVTVFGAYLVGSLALLGWVVYALRFR